MDHLIQGQGAQLGGTTSWNLPHECVRRVLTLVSISGDRQNQTAQNLARSKGEFFSFRRDDRRYLLP